jgi:hypothetical protein
MTYLILNRLDGSYPVPIRIKVESLIMYATPPSGEGTGIKLIDGFMAHVKETPQEIDDMIIKVHGTVTGEGKVSQ